MRKTVFKYKVKELDISKISGRIEKILCVQYQPSSESICVWALIDDDLPFRDFIVASYGTGHEVDDYIRSSDYIGTLQIYDGQIVAHFFAFSVDDLIDREEYYKLKEKLSPEMEMILK